MIEEATLEGSKVILNSEERRKLFTISNPIKGIYKNIESDIKAILIKNNTMIFKLSFSNGESLFLSYIPSGKSKDRYNYMVYNSYDDAIGKNIDKICSISVGIARDWKYIEDRYKSLEVSLCGVILKGL